MPGSTSELIALATETTAYRWHERHRVYRQGSGRVFAIRRPKQIFNCSVSSLAVDAIRLGLGCDGSRRLVCSVVALHKGGTSGDAKLSAGAKSRRRMRPTAWNGSSTLGEGRHRRRRSAALSRPRAARCVRRGNRRPNEQLKASGRHDRPVQARSRS